MTHILRHLFFCNDWKNCMRLFSLNHRHLNLGEIKSTREKGDVEGPSETGKFLLKLGNSP